MCVFSVSSVLSTVCLPTPVFMFMCVLNIFFPLKTAYHGFPKDASALAFEPSHSLLYIGTKSGELRVYPS